MSSFLSRLVCPLGALLLTLLPAGGTAQESSWNTPQVMRLVGQAVERRYVPVEDSVLRNYAARAEGHIHFLADRLDGSDPIPLRVDQVALELFWKAPNQTRQEIRGLRAEELLPIRDFRYYQDRLTVIQNGFGDIIEVGQGMDVRSVPHPLARYVQDFYDYALGDSVTVRLPGAPEPVRVVEVKVRPRDTSLPGYVGSMFLDAGSGAISKLEFTFTPVSYVDRRIDRVRITLEHGLWQGRWWLPFRQQVEVRREIPELDIRVQSVIQGVLTVEEYAFNQDLPPALFAGPSVVMPGPGGADPSHFRRGLFAEMEDQGLERPDLALLEAEARQMVRDRALSGLPATRLHLDRVSSLVRANRAEGVYAGAGLSRTVGADTRVSLLGGWASGSDRASGVAHLRWQRPQGVRVGVEVRGGRIRDLGPTPGADPFLNTLSTLLLGRDFMDGYRVDGGDVGVEWWPERGGTVRLQATYERHGTAGQAWVEGPVGDHGVFRSPPLIDEGFRSVLRGELTGPLPGRVLPGSLGSLAVEVGAFEGEALLRAMGGIAWGRRAPDGSRGHMVNLSMGVQRGQLPLQDRFLLGGAGTLPGHDYRAWGGDRFGLLSAETERGLIPGWVSLRGVAAVGAVGGRPLEPASTGEPPVCDPRQCGLLLRPPGPEGSGGVRASVGGGIGLVRGVLRIDHLWGLGAGGHGSWNVSVHPSFRPWL